tara:strand:+ start:126 stop:395 length:270 start_codon:yes stop_codon:yes gene_type:complete
MGIYKLNKYLVAVINIKTMFKIIIFYEIFFFLFWNILYFGADLKNFVESESMAFLYYVLSSMALGWVVVNTIRLSFGKIPDPREVAKKK